MTQLRDVITHLNVVLKNELTAINQYFLHARMLEHQGFTKLFEKEREESIDEMKHADKLMKRILFLGGLPNLQDLGRLMIGETPQEMLAADLKLEEASVKDLREAKKAAEAAGDSGTEILIEEIIVSEEEHTDWLRKQLALIEIMGLQNYLQTQV